MEKLPKLFAIGTLFLLATLTLSGCTQNNFVLDDVEIREYNGEKLSSVYDFRENSIKGPQYIDEANYTLKITGLVENPLEFTYEPLLDRYQSYQKVVTLYCVEGWKVTILWQGILIQDILDDAQPLEKGVTTIFHAYDGYTTSFPTRDISENNILMAYKMNNVTLPAERGFPFQLVAESKWGYKWIKWITEIELSSDTDYEGFWEQRGYSNSGNLSDSYYD